MNGLTKVTNDPIVQGAGAVTVVGVGSNENCRNRVPCLDEVSVQLDAGHRRHMDVSDQAGGFGEKSAADEKASTLYPSDLMSLLMDSRKYGSSSTTETNDAFGMGFRQFARTGHVGGAQQCGRVGMRIPQPAQRMPPVQCQWPVNFGLCPEPN